MDLETYIAGKQARRGAGNPQRVKNAAWEWMVRTGEIPYAALMNLGGDGSDFESKPDWCFSRFGMSLTHLPDGRRIYVAGEHEDWYDPDFFIYNDVIVRRDDDIEIYAYDESSFPPTDFHSATLIDTEIVLVGSLGYPKNRRPGVTQVLALDTESYAVRRIETSGDVPGWVHRHATSFDPETRLLSLRAGLVYQGGESSLSLRRNLDEFELDIESLMWRKTTDTSHWRQFQVRYQDRNLLGIGFELRDSGARLLSEYGYEVAEWFDADYGFVETEDELEDRDYEAELRSNMCRIVVEGVPVAIIDEYDSMSVIIEGALAPNTVDDLLQNMKRLVKTLGGRRPSVHELSQL
ncbi:MAG: hypothetical protein AAFR38_14720 [Planctomycetota bacterium]